MTHWKDRFSFVPAVFLVFEDDGKILLLRRANTGYNDGKFSLPAGHVDGQEPAHLAAVREAKEEVGVEVDPSDLELVHTQHRRADEAEYERIDLYFRVKKYSGTPTNMEPDKCDELRWVAYDDLPDDMISEVRHAVEGLARGRMYSNFNFS